MGKLLSSFDLKRWAWLGLGVGTFGMAWVVHVVVQHVRYERATFHPDRTAPVLPQREPFVRMSEVRLPYAAGNLVGWYAAPEHKTVVVVLAHGSMGRRDQMLESIEGLLSAGFGVLAYDFPGHGLSSGPVDILDQPNVVRAAVSEAKRLVPTAAVAALGFSMGAHAVIAAAAADPRIEAVIEVAGFADAYQQTLYEHRNHGWLSQLAALQTDAWYGLDLKSLRPVDLIAKLEPRPILIIHGVADAIVPAAEAERLYDAAKQPKELWLIESAGHGAFTEVVGAEYGRRLADFLNRRMLGLR